MLPEGVVVLATGRTVVTRTEVEGSVEKVEALLAELTGRASENLSLRSVEAATRMQVARWITDLFPDDLDATEKNDASFSVDEATFEETPVPQTERAPIPRSAKKRTVVLAEEDETLLHSNPKPPRARDDEGAFGEYQLHSLLGQGGMAEVYRASRAGVSCVIKRLAPALEHDPEYQEMFIEEARIARVLQHPHIVRSLDSGEIDGVPFIAFELIDGMDLAHLRDERGALPLEEVLQIGLQISSALAYAHSLPELALVHRDISPENILISRTGEAKLLDFGLSKFEGRAFQTRAGVIKGKLSYMAPEQIEGRSTDARTDLFQLGAVLAELFTGKKLLGHETLLNRPKDQVSTRKLLESHLAEVTVPRELFELLARMCAFEPAHRPRTALEVQNALAKIAAKPKGSRWPLAIGLTLVVLVTAWVAVHLLS